VQRVPIRELDSGQLEKVRIQLQKALETGDKEVLFEISSRGGDHDEVFDLITYLRTEKFQTSCIVTRAASAASLLAISCGLRKIRKRGKMFLHAVEVTLPVTMVTETNRLPESTVQKCRYRQRETESLIKQRTKIPPAELAKMMAPGAQGRFDAESAVRWGLVDEVIDY